MPLGLLDSLPQLVLVGFVGCQTEPGGLGSVWEEANFRIFPQTPDQLYFVYHFFLLAMPAISGSGAYRR